MICGNLNERFNMLIAEDDKDDQFKIKQACDKSSYVYKEQIQNF